MNRCLLVIGIALFLTECIETIDNSRPEHFVEDYIEAFSSGDDDRAWELVSYRCQTAISEEYFRAMVDIDGQYLQDLRIVNYSETIEGTAAIVTYEVNTPAEYGPIRQARWIKWFDGWVWDGCPPGDPRPRDLW